eukprot:TRINITY_DN9718_c0_g1_i1.p1 TRINITY_DN9718_c0_g1~~TRINITY_DN9718_c0_g1_i1.p1  ORF type:complete len:183 (+),score=21.08 TRINITY_DN9718_c0_g1_i1:49-597(+)
MSNIVPDSNDPAFESLKTIRAFIRKEPIPEWRGTVGKECPEHLKGICGGGDNFLQARWEEMKKKREPLQYQQDLLLGIVPVVPEPHTPPPKLSPHQRPPAPFTASPHQRTPTPFTASPGMASSVKTASPPRGPSSPPLPLPRRAGQHPSGYDPGHVSQLNQAAERHWGRTYHIPRDLTPVKR